MQNGGSLFPLEGLPSWAEWRQHVRCFSMRFTRLSSLSAGNPPQPPKHRVPTQCCQGERHLPFSEQTYRVQWWGRAQGRSWLHCHFLLTLGCWDAPQQQFLHLQGGSHGYWGRVCSPSHSGGHTAPSFLKLKKNFMWCVCISVYTHIHTYIYKHILKYIYWTLNIYYIHNISNTICIVQIYVIYVHIHACVCMHVCICAYLMDPDLHSCPSPETKLTFFSSTDNRVLK